MGGQKPAPIERSPLKAAVIGCGNITINGHGPALAALEGVVPVGVADPIQARRAEALDLMGLPAEAGFETHRKLLAGSRPDYVVVTVPQALRSEIIGACAELGVHALVEKPIATRPQQARAFAGLMNDAGLRLGLVHNYLYYPEFKLIRELIVGGEIGRLRHITLNFMGVPDNPGHADYQPLWRHDYQQAGGGILMDMIHVLYLAEYFFGSPIQSVSAAVDNLSQPGGQVEDIALLRLAFAYGYANIHLGWGVGPGGIEVTGTEGRALCFYKDYATGPFRELEELVIVGRGGVERRTPRTVPPLVETFIEVHSDFASALREGRQPAASAESGLRSLEAALAAYASAVTGEVVPLPLDPQGPLYRLGLGGLKELSGRPNSPLLAKGLFGLGLADQVALP